MHGGSNLWEEVFTTAISSWNLRVRCMCNVQRFIKAVKSFDLKKALPNLESHPYHWRVDPYERNRVWFTIRASGISLVDAVEHMPGLGLP